jgi:two-component system OmpR family sensor kinase
VSLRLRLALWYGGMTGVVVVLVCLYSYAVHSRAHYDEMDRMLHSAAAHVAGELQDAAPPDFPAVFNASRHLSIGLRLFDGEGHLVLQTPNARSLPEFEPNAVLRDRRARPYPSVAALAPALHQVDSAGGVFGLIRDERGHRWRVFLARIGGGERWLAAVQPLAALDASVRRFGQLMALMALIGAILTFAVGWLLAGRALHPVTVLTDEARTIAQSQAFTRRVPVEHPRDELGRLATTFNEMLESLETAYAAQQRFVSDASHELRAPLTVLQANLELLRRAPGLAPPERDQALAEAHVESERLARLVADLLALARADAGLQLRREPVELDRVLMDVLGHARHLAHGQRLEVGELEPIEVMGDADRLKQLILILVDNAIKYTPGAGRVALSLRRDVSTACLTVRDTGIGIAAEALPHVFERFYRADPARSRDPGGTGLGLSIARWIATQHGGTIEIESVPARGTTVVVVLPA